MSKTSILSMYYLAVLTVLEVLSLSSKFSSIGMDLDLNSLRGLEPIADTDYTDELYLPDYTDKELEEYKRQKGHKIDDYMEILLEDSDTLLHKKAKSIDLELSLVHLAKLMQLDYETYDNLLPMCMKANDIFYKLLKLDETIGINQEFRDTIVQLILQAKENIEAIKKVWEDYKEPIRAKSIRTFEQLKQDLDEVRQEYEEKIDNDEYEYGDYEKFYVLEAIERCQSGIVTDITKEKKIHRMLNVFMKEERNLVKLGIKLWVNSQEDYDIQTMEQQQRSTSDSSWSNHESAVMNEKKNQLRRKIITQMNVNRATVKNETANATQHQKSAKKIRNKEEL